MDTLQFLEQLCAEADAGRKAGNWAKMHFIASNPAVKYYFDNVYKLGISPQAFQYSPYFETAKAFHEAYEGQDQQAQTVANTAQRLTSLEGKLDKFINLVTPFIEAQTDTDEDDSDPEPEPEKPKARKRRTKKAEDSDEEGQEAPADDAEGDAEEAE